MTWPSFWDWPHITQFSLVTTIAEGTVQFFSGSRPVLKKLWEGGQRWAVSAVSWSPSSSQAQQQPGGLCHKANLHQMQQEVLTQWFQMLPVQVKYLNNIWTLYLIFISTYLCSKISNVQVKYLNNIWAGLEQQKIVNGELASPHEFPFMVSSVFHNCTFSKTYQYAPHEFPFMVSHHLGLSGSIWYKHFLAVSWWSWFINYDLMRLNGGLFCSGSLLDHS